MLVGRQIYGVEKALDALSLRFQVDADNLANVNTPHHVPSEVNFEASLKQALTASDRPVPTQMAGLENAVGPLPDPEQVLQDWQPAVTKESGQFQRVDGNGLSIEKAMSQVMETAQKYSTLVEVVADEYGNIKYVADQR